MPTRLSCSWYYRLTHANCFELPRRAFCDPIRDADQHLMNKFRQYQTWCRYWIRSVPSLRDIFNILTFLICLVSRCISRPSLGCTCSSGKPAQPPATHLHPAALLQPQRDRTVAHHRSNPVHPDAGASATPSHDGPLPADVAVRPAAALHGAEHAQPGPLPFRSAHGRAIRPHRPGQPGGPSQPSQRHGQRPLSLAPGPHPAPHPASDQRTGSCGGGAGPAHGRRQPGRSQWAADAADSGDGEIRVQRPGTS